MDDSRLTFSIPRPERQALEALARDYDLSLAQLARRGVRLLLAAELENQKPPAPVVTLHRKAERS